MEDLVEQTHRVELGGVDDAIGIPLAIDELVHPLGEPAAGREVRQDDVAGQGEQLVLDPVSLPGCPRDMEFEFHDRSSSLIPRSGTRAQCGRLLSS